jgi:integrase
MMESWARGEGVHLHGGLSSRAVDELGARFLGDLSEVTLGAMRQVGVNLPHGLCVNLGEHYRGRLPTVARVNKAWRRLHPPASHAPLPASWVDMLAVQLARQGEISMAIGALVLFDGFLRISELTNMTAADLLLPEDDRGGGSGAAGARVAQAKTGTNQFVSFYDPVVISYLRAKKLVAVDANQRLFPFTPAAFNAALGQACLALGIPVCTSHSFRHGAAARACLLGVHPEEIRRRGRWGSLAAMDTYLQTVRATLLSTDTPAWWAPFIPKLPRWRADLAQFSRQ